MDNIELTEHFEIRLLSGAGHKGQASQLNWGYRCGNYETCSGLVFRPHRQPGVQEKGQR